MEPVSAPHQPQKRKRQRLSIDSFDAALGDLSPIPDFKGPRVASNRQAVRRFLFEFQKNGVSKASAAKTTVAAVVSQHAGFASSMKEPRHLEPKLIELYDRAK